MNLLSIDPQKELSLLHSAGSRLRVMKSDVVSGSTSHQVTLDYGGAFVVNLARRSISPRQFGKDEMGSIKSVLFQKAVCFIHANAGGFSDPWPPIFSIYILYIHTHTYIILK